MKITQRSAFLLIVLVAVISFFRVYNFEFIIDDKLYISENSIVKQGIGSFDEIFKRQSGYGHELYKVGGKAYRPITLSSFALDQTLFDAAPGLMHLENLLLYIVTCLLIFIFLQRIFGSNIELILLLTLLFASLPVHQEAVCSIKSRDEILALLFLVSSLILLADALTKNKSFLLLAAILVYTIALFSKESAVAFIAIYPLFIYLLSKDVRKSIITSCLFLLPLLLFLLVRWQVIKDAPDGILLSDDNALLAIEGIVAQKLNAFYLLGIYFLKIFIPYTLLWDYSLGYWNFNGLTAFLGFLVITGFLLAIRYFWKKKQMISFFGLFFFLIGMSITSNIFYVIPSTFADRLLFTPSLGVLIMAGGSEVFRNKLLKFAPYLVGLYCLINIITVGDWKNELSLFEKDKDKLTSHRALVGYTRALINEKKFSPEIPKIIERANKIIPANESAETILGEYYIGTKNYVAANEHFHKALQMNPNSEFLKKVTRELSAYVVNAPGVDSRLTTISNMINTGKVNEVIEVINKELKVEPRNAELYYLLGHAYLAAQKFGEAIPQHEQAIMLNPRHLSAMNDLAVCYSGTGNTQKALDILKKGEIVNPKDFLTLKNLAIVYYKINDYASCRPYLAKALEINRYDAVLQTVKQTVGN